MAMAACTSTPRGKPIAALAPEINAARSSAVGPLIPGDILALRFPRSTEWTQERVLVREDGRASFLGLGDLAVVGRSVADVRRDLAIGYEALGILEAQQLTVSLTQAAVRTFSVLGEVKAPGSYPVSPTGVGLLEGLALAGGFTRDTALLGHALLVRWVPDDGNLRAWRVDLRPQRFDESPTVLLQAHDVLYVPAKPVVHVNDWIDRYIRRNLPFPFIPI